MYFQCKFILISQMCYTKYRKLFFFSRKVFSFFNKILKTPCVPRSHCNVLYETTDRRGPLNRGNLSQRASALSPGAPESASSFSLEAKSQAKDRLRAELRGAVS